MGNGQNKEEKVQSVAEEYERQSDLPKPILSHIFSFLRLGDIFNLSLACKQFYFVTVTQDFWKQFCEKNFPANLEEKEKSWKEKANHLSPFFQEGAGGRSIMGFVVGKESALAEFDLIYHCGQYGAVLGIWEEGGSRRVLVY